MIDQVQKVDLTDPETFTGADLADYWSRLRKEAPVSWHPGSGSRPGFWVVSRMTELMSVYRDPENFTSQHGNVLATLLDGRDPAGGKMCAVTDGTRHRDIRNLLLRAFSPRTMHTLAEQVSENIKRLVSAAVAKGQCDFATEVSEHIPMATISDLLGVPRSDHEFLLSRSRSALSSDVAGQSDEDARSARSDILLYFSDLMDQRRGSESDDVISVLTNGIVGGEHLARDEVVLNCYSLILGGDETSRLTMNDVVFTLACEHEQRLALCDGSVSTTSACEEALRWATPTMHFGRTATSQVMLAGQRIMPGDVVTLWHSSANRDELWFADPHRFNLSREPNKHVAFGYGPHYCIGASLARMEITALLCALRSLTEHIEVTGEVSYFHSNFLRGISRLPVEFKQRNHGR
jgi:cytochrome P450